MTHQDTEFSAVYLLFNGEEPGAGESQFRGRGKGREEDRGQLESESDPAEPKAGEVGWLVGKCLGSQSIRHRIPH